MLRGGEIATCAVIDLEVLYSSRNRHEYDAVLARRRRLEPAPITPSVLDDAIELQARLARRGQHRMPVLDIVISATARAADLTVLHYDADFERLAAVGGARQRWIAPPGTL